MKKVLGLLAIFCLVLLTGCENSGASYVIDNSKNHSISLLREQNIPWVGQVEQRFVVARFPDCQRRYTVEATGNAMEKIDLYEVRPMLYAARQGNTWYALSTEVCQVQKFTEPPPVIPPGRLLGSFEKRDDALAFTAAKP